MTISDQEWQEIRRVFRQIRTSSVYFSLATVSESGEPYVSPIGSLILCRDKKGYYFDKFFNKTAKNVTNNPRVCILAVNNGKWFWLRSLFQGRFPTPPGLRLMGTVSSQREATPDEIAKWQKIIKPLRFFKGYKLLWRDMKYVREITFDSFEPVKTGEMTKDLW